jgi:predicted permease
VAFTPLLYTVLIGFIFALIKYQPPYEFTSTIDRLYAVTIPLAVVITGMAFGKSVYLIDLNSYMQFLPSALFCTLFRLVISPLLAWGIASMMEIDNAAAMRSVILSAGLPTGVFAMVVTGAFSKHENHGYAAFVILFTSVMSFLTMPLLIILVNHYFPL